MSSFFVYQINELKPYPSSACVNINQMFNMSLEICYSHPFDKLLLFNAQIHFSVCINEL
jgi:hypothetical protein